MNMRVTRLGFLRYADEIMPEDEEEIVEALAFLSCVPVFLDKALANKFYREFCKVGLVGLMDGLVCWRFGFCG